MLCKLSSSAGNRCYRYDTHEGKDYQILVDGDNYNELHSRYGAGRSFNEVVTEILRHHESAVSIIGDCESLRRSLRRRFKNNDNNQG